MCLKVRMQMFGSNWVILLTVVVPPFGLDRVPVYSPGGELRGTAPMQLTGSPFGMILGATPLTALFRFGSFHILITSCCMTSQVSGEA
jgi:hypothetical protein